MIENANVVMEKMRKAERRDKHLIRSLPLCSHNRQQEYIKYQKPFLYHINPSNGYNCEDTEKMG